MGERDSAVNRWSLVEEQSALFRQTFDENLLERELSVWKLALAKADEDGAHLKSTNTHLQQNDNPLLLCLKELMTQGHAGGRQAALLLTKGLTDYTAGATDTPQIQAERKFWLTVFCQQKLAWSKLLVNQDQSARRNNSKIFALGFNLAAPLFSIVDVGARKEAADAKIKGGHDNGYTSALTSLENEGFLNKVVLLRGYKDVALELKNLRLPELTIDGVFMTRKLQTNVFQRNRNHFPESLPSVSAPASPKKSSTHTTSTFGDEPRYLEPGVTPPPCTFFYLAVCKQGVKCTYGHGYTLTPANYTDLHKVCPSGDSCCSGHFCPRGENCNLLKRRTCKFVGHSMHTKPSVSRNVATSNSSLPSGEDTKIETTGVAAQL
ncbi:hypothetical protein B0H14DRAFT_2948732 [Mycena olivaceomarginata]|nr:hypothetical protein B0H14DRAFT_2948732 [Mycena olivaceomarginata]